MLRGCIGTFEPKSLAINLPTYTLISAFKDSRFPPIKSEEVNLLKCSVSLLHSFEEAKNAYDWEVGKHGMQIEFKVAEKEYHSTYLPEVAKEQNWNQQKTIKSLIKKAGYSGEQTEELINSIKIKRYQSQKCSAEVKEYIEFMNSNHNFFT